MIRLLEEFNSDIIKNVFGVQTFLNKLGLYKFNSSVSFRQEDFTGIININKILSNKRVQEVIQGDDIDVDIFSNIDKDKLERLTEICLAVLYISDKINNGSDDGNVGIN